MVRRYLFAALLGLIAPRAVAAELDPELAETFRWFPAETSGVLVAQDFEYSKHPDSIVPADADDDALIAFIRAWAIGRPLAHDSVQTALDKLVGRRVEHAVLAGRQFIPISVFGFIGYAGCHVVRFAEPLGDDAAPLAEALRKDAAQVVSLAGRDVAAFTWSFDKEPYLKDQSWEELLVVLPRTDDRELILATQRTMLEESLARRADRAAPRAALPPALPVWKHVDLSAAAWSVLAAPSAPKGPPSTTDVISWEYHHGDKARFVLVSPPASLPDVDPAKIDPYGPDYQMGPLALVSFLSKQDVPYSIGRPAGEPVRLTVTMTTPDVGARAMRRLALTFSTGALFGYCIEPRR